MVGVMNGACHILHLEDDRFDGELIRRVLVEAGLGVGLVRVATRPEYSAALDRQCFDIILSDYTLPAFDGIAALAMAREKQPDTPFIFVSGTIEEDMAIESLKSGASDYVFKSRLSRLAPAIRRALQSSEERKESLRAEEAMRQSEHKYRQVFESMLSAAFLTDFESGRVIDANPQGEMLLGRSRAEIIGLNENRFLSPQTFPAYRQAIAAADAGRCSVDTEVEVLRKDGTPVPANVRAGIMMLYNRKLVLGLYRDITARKHSDERLRQQAALLDIVPEAVIAHDMDDRIQIWNQGAARLYGWSSCETSGRKSTEFLYHDLAEFNAARQSTLQKGDWSGELHQLTCDNHEILVHSHWALTRDAQGRPESIMVVSTQVGENPVNRLKMSDKIGGRFHNG